MKKHYDPLDDYTDHSPSLALEIVKYIMPRMIFVVGCGLILAVCAYLEML
jgi:hypothetical protein